MNKSKSFLEQRQNRITERLDPSWQPVRTEPVLEGGNIHYEVSGRIQAIGCGGLGLLQSVVEATGLPELVDLNLDLLKRHKPYHESDHVLALAYNILTGGEKIEDLDRLRRNEAALDALGARRLPGATTAGDFLRRFDAEQVGHLIDAMLRASANVWQTRPVSERRLALIDVDGTLVDTTGECKEKMDISFNGRWGFGPLVVSLANTQEVLSVVNRPANRPSHDGAAEWMDKTVDWAKHQAGFERVRLRGDTDFSLTTHFDRWNEQDVEFVFGMDASEGLVKRAQQLVEESWKPLQRPERPVKRRRPENVKKQVVQRRGFKNLKVVSEHVAEIDYSPSKAQETYRLIILKKRLEVTKGQLCLNEEIRYFFYITNISKDRMSTAQVVRESNARCHQENLIEQLKNGVQATRMPVAEFDANWAYLVIGSLAWNIKAWAGMLLPRSLGARQLLTMEFRRFLNEVILVAAQILHSGRRLIFRLLEVNNWSRLLLEGTDFLRRRRRVA
jgi:hypothetical protein